MSEPRSRNPPEREGSEEARDGTVTGEGRRRPPRPRDNQLAAFALEAKCGYLAGTQNPSDRRRQETSEGKADGEGRDGLKSEGGRSFEQPDLGERRGPRGARRGHSPGTGGKKKNATKRSGGRTTAIVRARAGRRSLRARHTFAHHEYIVARLLGRKPRHGEKMSRGTH
jgi:hypothetical protein